MRNRGIEIYMFNESNDFDLKSLLGTKGLKDKSLINALIDIHEFTAGYTLGKFKTGKILSNIFCF